MMMMSFLTSSSLFVMLVLSIHSYPFNEPSTLNRFCSSIMDLMKIQRHRRFAVPFPDMNRFLSTSHKLHHRHSHTPDTAHVKSGTELGMRKVDFHAYLCSIAKNKEAMNHFLSIFMEEHGQPPAFDLFESCEPLSKRNGPDSEFMLRIDKLAQVCLHQHESTSISSTIL